MRVPRDLTGIHGGSVRVRSCGSLDAIVSDVPQAPLTSDLAAIRAHDATLRSVAGTGTTVVAVRFGQTFAGDEELCAAQQRIAADTAAMLEALDGQVEMRVLVHADAIGDAGAPADAPASGPGRAYLESLRRSVQTHDLSLRAAIGPVVRRERVERLTSVDGVVFAHLVRFDDLAEYREVIAQLPMLGSASVVGPLPLYSFAHIEDG